MSNKSHRFADPKSDHSEHADPTLMSPAPRRPLADPANTNVVFFDDCLAYAYGHGVGAITLTTLRQLVDPSGQVFEDRVITGLLRASLTSLQNLKQVIVEIEKIAERVAANASAANEQPIGRPH